MNNIRRNLMSSRLKDHVGKWCFQQHGSVSETNGAPWPANACFHHLCYYGTYPWATKVPVLSNDSECFRELPTTRAKGRTVIYFLLALVLWWLQPLKQTTSSKSFLCRRRPRNPKAHGLQFRSSCLQAGWLELWASHFTSLDASWERAQSTKN